MLTRILSPTAGPFSPDAFCANIAKYQITTSFVVPPILLAMAKHPAPTKYDMTSLFSLVSGAAPLSDSLSNAVVARMKGLGANISVLQGYGLTETSPTVFFLTEDESITKMGSVGRMISNIQIRLIVDGPGEVDAKDGEPGEIWVRGPSIMKGYLNNPKANAEVLTKDGFFKTGDIAIRDSDGFYRIVDRKKELIKYKVSWLRSLLGLDQSLTELSRVSKFLLRNSKPCSSHTPRSRTLQLSACTRTSRKQNSRGLT
jgi:4-coumarate--CoA ligase